MCAPGEPWIGTGSGAGCDPRIITSFDRLVETAGCELTPKGAPLPVPACDGQHYPNEEDDRSLPCWAADVQGACRMTHRTCRDNNGVGFIQERGTDSTDAMLPSAELCARYLACEQEPCTHVAACFKSKLTQMASLRCKLPIDPTSAAGEKIRPCGGGSWKTQLPTTPTSAPPASLRRRTHATLRPIGSASWRRRDRAVRHGGVPRHLRRREPRRPSGGGSTTRLFDM